MSYRQVQEIDKAKRTWLIASGCAGAVGGVATAVPFVASFTPSERAKAAGAPVEVDIGALKPGENPMVPTVTIQTRDGKYRVIGFGSVLKRELEDGIEAGTIKVGNLMAVKYWGEKPIKKGPFAGKNYRHYSVAAQAPKKKA